MSEVLAVEREAAAAFEQMRFHGDSHAESERQHQDKGVAPRHLVRGELHAADHDHREALHDHAAHDADGDGSECGAELPDDSEHDEPTGARKTGRARRATRERDDSIVLAEGRVRGRCEDTREE